MPIPNFKAEFLVIEKEKALDPSFLEYGLNEMAVLFAS
jgi:hypothetical protein